MKRHVLGPDQDDEKEIEFLGRTISWTSEGLVYKAGDKHVKELIKEFGLDGGNGVATPGESVSGSRGNGVDGTGGELLDVAGAKAYRRGAARLNYLSQDRPDLAFSTKEIAQGMAKPTMDDVTR